MPTGKIGWLSRRKPACFQKRDEIGKRKPTPPRKKPEPRGERKQEPGEKMSETIKIVEKLKAFETTFGVDFTPDDATEAIATIEALVGALEPFLKHKDGTLIDPFKPEYAELDDDVICEREVNFGDLRRARAALTAARSK